MAKSSQRNSKYLQGSREEIRVINSASITGLRELEAMLLGHMRDEIVVDLIKRLRER